MTSIQQQALDALLSFGRSARTEGRAREGFHYLGDSPANAGYQVKLMFFVRHDIESKSYRITLAVSEERFEGGFNSQKYGFGMPSKDLGSAPSGRFHAGRIEEIYDRELAKLKRDPQPLIELLQEESERGA